jgi:hypothetical protein
MKMQFCFSIIAITTGANLAFADHLPRPREPDAAELIKGDWVMRTVEHKGIVTPQIETRGELALDWIAHLGRQWENQDKALDLPPSRVLPPPPRVYHFSGGRITVREDLRQIGEGRYRFVAGKSPIVELKWDLRPDGARDGNWNRLLFRFGDETMSWCHDTERPNQPPTRFVAKDPNVYILTFGRVQ